MEYRYQASKDSDRKGITSYAIYYPGKRGAVMRLNVCQKEKESGMGEKVSSWLVEYGMENNFTASDVPRYTLNTGRPFIFRIDSALKWMWLNKNKYGRLQDESRNVATEKEV